MPFQFTVAKSKKDLENILKEYNKFQQNKENIRLKKLREQAKEDLAEQEIDDKEKEKIRRKLAPFINNFDKYSNVELKNKFRQLYFTNPDIFLEMMKYKRFANIMKALQYEYMTQQQDEMVRKLAQPIPVKEEPKVVPPKQRKKIKVPPVKLVTKNVLRQMMLNRDGDLVTAPPTPKMAPSTTMFPSVSTPAPTIAMPPSDVTSTPLEPKRMIVKDGRVVEMQDDDILTLPPWLLQTPPRQDSPFVDLTPDFPALGGDPSKSPPRSPTRKELEAKKKAVEDELAELSGRHVVTRSKAKEEEKKAEKEAEKEAAKKQQEQADKAAAELAEILAEQAEEEKGEKESEEPKKKRGRPKKTARGLNITAKSIVNDLKKRLKILIGARMAGNNSRKISNEIYDILDLLLKHKQITKTKHKQIIQEIKLIP